MAITISRVGKGQVEPNHLSAPRDGRVYAQLPAAAAITELENGMFIKYDYAAGQCQFTGNNEWMLVYNEEKLYDPRHQMHRDWSQKVDDSYDGKIYPRVFGTVVGDIMTTNMVVNGSYSVGNTLTPGSNGILAAGGSTGDMIWKVVKETTLPDGQAALKLQRVQ